MQEQGQYLLMFMKRGAGDPIHNPLPPVSPSLTLSGKCLTHLGMPPCSGSLTHGSYLKTCPSTSLSFPPIVHASQLPAKGLLDSCFPLQVEPGAIGTLSQRVTDLLHTCSAEMAPTAQHDCFLIQEILDT